MSFASGFFNSVDHDRLYDATDISRLFDGLIRDGIFASIGDCLVVKQSNQMNVTVGTGRAWFNHTWSYNDALYPVTIPPSEILMDRIDAIVLEINSVESVRANSIKLIKGTPASTPTKPALTNTKEVHQYPLAYVKVGKEVTSIRQADIENCVGTSVCPFVTGILEVISIEQLIPQWKDILNRFVEENTANFNTWMNGEKQEYQDWLAAAKKEITDWEATSKSDYQKWYDSIKNGYDQWFATIKAAYDANWSTFQQWEKSSQDEFDQWFENIKNKLEGDLGAKLTLEAEKLGKEKVSLIESTKTDLTGTVEAPLMVGNAMRNLLDSNLSGFANRNGIKIIKNEDYTYTLNGTARANVILYLNGNNLQATQFKNTVGGCKLLGCPKNGSHDTYRIDVRYYENSEFNSEVKAEASDIGNGVIIDDAYPYLVYRLYINKGTTVTNLTFKPMVTTDLEATIDDFVPYSGYDIKTIGKNLLPYPYVTASGSVSHGVTMTCTKEGIISLDGTISGDTVQPGFVLYQHVEKLFNNTIDTLYSKYDTTIPGTLHTFFQIFKNGLWVTNVETLSKNDYDWTNYSCNYIIQYHKTTGDVHGTVSNIRIVTNGNDPFVPYTESTVHIDSSTEFPNFDLKSFDGATHIISPGNVQSFHADAPNGKYLLESIKKSAESGGVSYGVNAPTNPKVGDLWIDPSSGSLIQYWTGSKWTPTRALDIYGSDVVKSDSKPNAKRSTLWIDSGNGNAMKHVAEDGTVTELSSGGTSYGATAPSNTKLLWIDTSGVARFYNGSAWVPLAATWG